MMAQDPNRSTRGEGTRDTGSRSDELTTRGTGDVERQRNLETGRDTGGRQSSLARRTPMFGTTSSPFSLMRRMAEDIERLFDADLGRAGFGLGGTGQWRSPYGSGRMTEFASWAPQVETFRRDNNLVVRADLPGMKKDDVNIEVEDDILMISGERSSEDRDEEDDYYRSERSYGRFFRAIQLPDGVDADKIDASFKDGVLEVTVPAPKVTTPSKRQVKIR